MSTEGVVLRGTLRPDGTLELAGAVGLPPGPVEVTVRAAPDPAGERLPALLARIRAGQRARGHVPRTAEEIDAEIRRLRDESEEELQAIERLHEDCRRSRAAPPEAGGSP